MSWKNYTPYLPSIEVSDEQYAEISDYLKSHPERDIGDVRVHFNVIPEVVDEVIRRMQVAEAEYLAEHPLERGLEYEPF